MSGGHILTDTERAHEHERIDLASPADDDPAAALMPLVKGDVKRWMTVVDQILARTSHMTRERAVASVRADLEAGRL
jgi:hypothetical protein